jgi:class 3 adenylate cyclase/pimeloyl-ACP methyl ester carboxylesterase
VRCPSCSFENASGIKFCGNCGASLKLRCGGCGFENTPGVRFCGECGKALGSPVASTAAVEPSVAGQDAADLPQRLLSAARGDGERRQVTVLFCDLAGSTAIAERLDPEVYRQLINEYLERSIACVYRYEGTVNQIAGDGFMAIFGAPVAHDDDAARACRAGREITAAIRAISEQWSGRLGGALAARIGLNTGLVVVGAVGSDLRMDYSAIGDTTNVAARIESVARPGEVFLSETTRKLVAHRFETEAVGSETFKGKRDEVAVFRLGREVSARERRHHALRGGLSRFCGRRSELGLLVDRFAEARAGAGQVVFIAGDAGIGKSRLVHEFHRRLDSMDYVWVEGQCVSYGKLSTYHPFIDLLRGIFAIEESDSPETIIGKVDSFCASRGGLVARGEPFYRDLLAVDPGEPRLDGMLEPIKASNYSDSIRDLLLALSRERPVLFLMEDVHWIDRSSEELLRRLVDSIAAARVLVLVTHRPGYAWPHGERSYFSRLSLHGLPPSLVEELVESVLGRSDLPKPMKRLVAERSDGNPFFVEEIAKSLEELGALGLNDAAVAEEVPATLQGVILARIDRLDEEAKHALQVASVIGREFAVRVLERVQDWKTSPSESLEKLRSLELIYEKAVHPDLAYMFKHALTHDVAYGTLLHAQRRELHRRIAMLVEEIYAERLPEFYETLAYQYLHAEIAERAAHYALLAAERAASHLAPEAEHYFRQAADLARRLHVAGDVLARALAGLGDQLILRGETAAANELYEEAIRSTQDEERRLWLSNKISHRSFVERDGVRLAYYVQGPGSSDRDVSPIVPIVMLHPWAQGAVNFQQLAQRLCQQHCVIYMDPRGAGASGKKPGERYDFTQRVDDVLAILRSLPYSKFVLFGDSDGVRVAVDVFHAIPDRIAKLILFGGGVCFRLLPDYPIGLSDAEAAQLLEIFAGTDHRASLQNFCDAAISEPGASAWKDIIVEDWAKRFDHDTWRQFFDDIVACDQRHLLPEISVPTLVIAAEGDRLALLPFNAYLAEHIPGATFALIKGSSHAAPWTACTTFLEIMTTFIDTATLPHVEWVP